MTGHYASKYWRADVVVIVRRVSVGDNQHKAERGFKAKRALEPEADGAAETYRVPSAYRDVASKVNRPSTAPSTFS